LDYLTYTRAGVAGAAIAVVAAIGLSRHRWTATIHAALAGFGTALAIDVIRSHPQIAHGTGSRGAGAVLAVLVFACVLCILGVWLCTIIGTDRWRLSKTGFKLFGTACTIVVLLLAAAFGPHLAKHAWHQFRNPSLPPAGSNPTQRLTTLSGTRYNLWAVAVDAFTAYPLTGTGAGTYEFWWNRHQRDSEFVLNAHSLWFENMAELGAPGLLAIIAFAAGALALLAVVRRRAGRRTSTAASTAAVAAFIVFLVQASVDWMWQSTAVTVLALAALASASARLSTGSLRLRVPARALLAAAAVLAAAVQIPGLESTLETRRSQAAERAGNGALAIAWAKAAVSSEPWAASPYDQEALVLESAGRLQQAVVELRHATAKEPDNYAHWLLLARVQTERGRLSAAARDYARARSLGTKGEVFNPPR
jgi:O-antigen ligase